MTTRLAISTLAAAALAAGAADAAPIPITAGEHGLYSRIVVAGGKSIAVNRTERTVDVRVDNGATFDLSDINDRRKAHRVVAAQRVASGEGAVIRLKLSCDCTVESKATANGKLVVDIRDGARAAPSSAPGSSIAEEDDDDSLAEARDRMIELLQRAADEGLINIRDGSSDLQRTREASVASVPLPVEAASPIEAAAPDLPARACLDEAVFAIDGAPFEAEPLVAISALQNQMAAAGAARQAEIARALVDGYLSIGFGEEAFVVLSEYGERDGIRADLARVVAERAVDVRGPLMGGADCRGPQALWQAAAGEPDVARLAVKRAGDAAALLPTRLRAVITTRIAKKMILAGDWAEARRFYTLASDASSLPTNDLEFIAAKLLEQEGRTDEAERLLKDLAAGNTEASRDALLALAARYAAGESPHEGFVEDIGALAKMSRGSPAGADAAFREAMAWAAAGNIEASVLLLRNATGGEFGEGGAASGKARELLAQAFASGDEKTRGAALSAYLENKDFADDGADPAFRRVVAETATALGLPNVALRVLRESAARTERDSAALARAALASGDGEAALAAAAPYAGDPSFAPLIVEANLKLARNTAALAAAASLSNSYDRASMGALAAWRAGDWASAARAFQMIDPQALSEESAMHYAFAAYMAGETFMPPAAEAVLKGSKSGSYAGLKALFAAPASGPIVDRSKAVVDGAGDDLKLIEEILDHG